VTIADARVALEREPADSADVVVGDAFGNYVVPWHLATREWTAEVARVLRPGGLYALNVIDFAPLSLLRAEAVTLLERFSHVRLVTHPAADGRPAGGNGVLLASDRPLPAAVRSSREGGVTYLEADVARFVAGAAPLRDDFAPTDQLLTATPSRD
jgi:spermidine synthase